MTVTENFVREEGIEATLLVEDILENIRIFVWNVQVGTATSNFTSTDSKGGERSVLGGPEAVF